MLAELYGNNPQLSDWANFENSIIPGALTYDLGSAERPWRSLYVSSNTIYIGETAVGVSPTGKLTIGGNDISSEISYASIQGTPTTLSQFLNDSDYATETYVTTAISNIPAVDLSSYATETYVTTAISNIPAVDLSSYATETYVGTQIANLVDSSPVTLNTLNELAAALGDDPNFATTIATSIGLKADTSSLSTVATSGNYNDLSGLPTIPALPLQTSASGKFLTTDGTVLSWASVTSTTVGLGNVTNESKATMFTSPTFTGTVNVGSYIDFKISGGSTGQVLTTDGLGNLSWTTVSGGGGSVNLDGLTDVVITAPSIGQVLKWDGAQWINDTDQTASAGGDTTYSISAETVTGGANLRLLSSGAATDDVKIASGTGITVARTDANTITISSSGTGANSFGIIDVLASDGVTSLGTVTSDAANDTLTLVGSLDIVITPIPGNDSVTFELANAIPTDINQLADIDGLLTGVAVLPTRGVAQATTASLANNATDSVTVTGFKSYALYKIQTSAAAWVRLYTTTAARTADASRLQGTDPAAGSGVIAEVITTGAQTIITAPGVFGFNDESTPTTAIATAVTNLSGSAAAITVTLTLLQLEG